MIRYSEKIHLSILKLSFILSLMGCEWIWLATTSYFYVLIMLLPTMPLLIALGLIRGAFLPRKPDVGLVIWTLLGAFCFSSLTIIHLFFSNAASSSMFAASSSMFRLSFYYTFPATFVAGVLGYHFGTDRQSAPSIVKWFATAASFLGPVLCILPMAQPGDVFPSSAVGYPVGLLVLFGLCWYAHGCLVTAKLSVRLILGFLAAMSGVFLPFHKPIVLPALGGLIFLVAVMLNHRRVRLQVLVRASAFALLATISFLAAIAVTSGTIMENVEEKILTKYLHQGRGYISDTEFDLLESASGGRFDIWTDMSARVFESPFFGHGFGQTLNSISGEGGTIPVHNAYLDMILSVGIIGSLPFAIGIPWWLWQILTRDTRYPLDDLRMPVLTYCVCMSIVNMGSMIYFFQTVSMLTFFMMGLSLGWVRNRD